jgi:hypothetical protein
MSNVEVGFLLEDGRPAFVLEPVHGTSLENVKSQKAAGASTFVLKDVENFEARHCTPVTDVQVAHAVCREL